jgi:hypothetical protein
MLIDDEVMIKPIFFHRIFRAAQNRHRHNVGHVLAGIAGTLAFSSPVTRSLTLSVISG